MSLKNSIRYNPILRRIVTALMVNMEYPSVLGIDPTNACNLKCSFCGASKAKGSIGFMDMELFKKIIRESLSHGKRCMIILHNSGEPLLHKDICAMVEFVKVHRAARNVQFSTNGILLTEELARGLIKAGLDQITFSVDAYTPEEYRLLKGADLLNAVIENAKMLMRLKKESRSRYPVVSAKMVRRRGFEHTFKPFLKMWSGIADEALLTPYSNWGGAVGYNGTEEPPARRYACHFLWYYPVVNWDGRVFHCCASCEDAAVVGDLRNCSMADVWRSKKLEDIRQAHLESDFGRASACAKCSYWAESGCGMDAWFTMKQNRQRG
jgi:radical SAM protein with 4Fe4S-binding SPASM domain